MKRLLYLCGALTLIAGFLVAGGRGYAAHQSAPALAVKNVRLCSSSPVGVAALKGLSTGIFNGVKLATSQWKARFARVGLNLLPPLTMDDARSDGVTYGTDQERQNALSCLNRSDTFGYIGTLNSGAALVSEPILNQGAMVQISPANTGPILTSPTNRAAQEPATYSHKLAYVTYYRTVTTDNLQGPAGAAFLNHALAVKRVFLVDDKQTYGAGLASTFKAYAQKLGMKVVGTGHIDPTDSSTISTSTDAIADQIVSANPQAVYCGCDSETALPLPKKLRQRGYTKPFTGGDALFNQSWITDTGIGSRDNFVTSVGPDPAATSKSFQVAYRNMFHIPLEAYDATSYDAANIVLKAIYEDVKGGHFKGSSMFALRKSILPYVASIKYKGATGVTTFDRNGDTTNRVVSIYKTVGSTWKFVTSAPPVAGAKPTS